jgi:hypothetical protein
MNKTLDEWFPEGRGNGMKFTEVCLGDYSWYEPIFRVGHLWNGIWSDGKLMTVSGDTRVREWHPPKKTKKVTMYRPIRRSSNAGHVIVDSWRADKSYFVECIVNPSVASIQDIQTIVGWQECEVTVDEN